MTREFKRTFFSSSIAILLVLSNLIGLKYTNFASFVLPVSFITYPLISLCVVMLVDLYGRRTAKQAIYTGFILQIFVLLVYLLATNLSNQTIISDMAYEINNVFTIKIVPIITSLILYVALSSVIINLFDNYKLRNQKSIGSLLEGYEVLLKLLYTNLIASLFMTMISYGLYYVLRESFEYSEPEMVSTKDKSIKTLLEEEKIVVEDINDIKTKKKSTKKTVKNGKKSQKKEKK